MACILSLDMSTCQSVCNQQEALSVVAATSAG
jgi:hypothetical protein